MFVVKADRGKGFLLNLLSARSRPSSSGACGVCMPCSRCELSLKACWDGFQQPHMTLSPYQWMDGQMDGELAFGDHVMGFTFIPWWLIPLWAVGGVDLLCDSFLLCMWPSGALKQWIYRMCECLTGAQTIKQLVMIAGYLSSYLGVSEMLLQSRHLGNIKSTAFKQSILMLSHCVL